MEGGRVSPAEEKSKAAILHVLQRIHDHPSIGYYMGFATESFALLTGALSVLINRPTEEIVERFLPKNAADPAMQRPAKSDEESINAGQCSAETSEVMVDSDVFEYLELISTPARMELLRDIRSRFCVRCGGDQGLAKIPCQCNVGISRRFRQLEIAR